MSLLTDLTAAVAQATADAAKLHAIAQGPASGPTSTVTTDGGDVKTLARISAELTTFLATFGGLATLAGADTASGDYIAIYDLSAGVLKTITRAELKTAIIDQQLGYTPENAAGKGAAGGYAALDGAGLVPTAQLPAMAITDVFTVADQTAMLALSAEKGDVAVRTDVGKSFILSTNSPSTLADWKEITAVGAVTSVAGRTGAVVIAVADIADAAPLASPAFTGLPTAAAYAVGAGNVNAQTGTTYELQNSDNGKTVTLSNASAIALTVPTALTAGFACTLVQLGAGQVTITASSTTLRHRNGLKLAGQYAQAGLFYIAADTYSVGGDLTT